MIGRLELALALQLLSEVKESLGVIAVTGAIEASDKVQIAGLGAESALSGRPEHVQPEDPECPAQYAPDAGTVA